MNWKQQIFKPKWQHKDPEVRREAVSTGQEPELLAALGELCLADEAPSVRIAAARRLADLETLHIALGREADDSVLGVLAERVRQLAAASTDERPPLETRRKIVAESVDRELLEAVASTAPESELRREALRKIDRQGFLGDRAVADPDPAIRRAAAAAITQHSTLRRVIEQARTTDKALHQELERRLHLEMVGAGDRQAVDREALDICTEMESAAVTPDPVGGARIDAFRERWARLEGRARPEHQERFDRDLARLSGAESEPGAGGGEAPDTRVTAVPEERAPDAVPADEPVPDERPASAILEEATQVLRDYRALPGARLAAKKIAALEHNFTAAWATIAEPNQAEKRLRQEAEEVVKKLHEKLQAASARRDEALAEAGELVDELRQNLEHGELHKALEIRQQLFKLGKKLGKEQRWRQLSAQINSMQGRLRELRGWQHWSNNRIRKAMIKEMEALPMADLHPDAVLERIKELQARWKELEQSEQIPGDKHFAAAPWMWRKFSAAGRKAFEATKPFLDKRSEIQKKHLESMRALASRIVELAAEDSPDWGEMTRVVRKGRRAMRSLGEVPARARHKMAQQLKAALEKGNKALQAHYEVVEKRKLKLIHEANQLAHVADRGEAISRAKALQAEWKAAGSLWRSRENKLWSEFRQPLDPLFEDLQAEQKSIRDRREAMLADQKALCAGLESVLELEDGELLGQHGRVQGLKDAWSDFRHPDRRLQQTFSRLLDRYRERLEAQEHKAERALRDTWWEKAALLHKAESAAHAGKLTQALKTRLRKAWPAEQSGEDLDTQLEARFETALGEGPAPAPEGTAEQETARKLCICLEFLAGLPSPAQEKDLRMQYQVDRLSESLSGERKRMSAVDEAKMLEAEWLALPWIPDRDYDVFGKRIKKALKTIEQG